MPTSVTLKTDGLATIDRALRDLPAAVASDILRDALHAGGKVIRAGIAEKIRSRTGRTVKDLRTEVFVQGLAGTAETGGNPDRKAKTGRGHILNFLEFGTKPHREPKLRGRLRRFERQAGQTLKSINAKKRVAFGGKVFSRVQHPRTHAQAPMRRTIAEQGIPAVNAFGRAAWEGIVVFLKKRTA